MRLQPRKVTLLVVLGALLLTTLGVKAVDYIQGGQAGQLLACGAGEVMVNLSGKVLCVDQYEASPDSDCPYAVPLTERDTASNIARSCGAISGPGVMPWRFVSYVEAKQICAQSGKRLLLPREWYELALGTLSVEACFADGKTSALLTGENNCKTSQDLHDLVGNVWEWTDAIVTNGTYADRTLPNSGYIKSLDMEGIVTEVQLEPGTTFADDYAWVSRTGTVGILRGGFYGSGSDGGVFAQNINTETTSATPGIGFRCVREIIL